MPNSLGLPEFCPTDAPEDFVRKLRQHVFKNQIAAACYHGVNRSTISKYERYDYERDQHRIVPPIGYIASLARLTVEREEKSGADEAHLNSCKMFLLTQIARLLKAYPVEYRYMEPFHNWQQLCMMADAYRVEHRHRQTETGACGTTQANRMESSYPTDVPTIPAYTAGANPAGSNAMDTKRSSRLPLSYRGVRFWKRMKDRLPACLSRLDSPMLVAVGMVLAALMTRWLPPRSNRAW